RRRGRAGRRVHAQGFPAAGRRVQRPLRSRAGAGALAHHSAHRQPAVLARHIFFAASLSFLPLFLTSPLICSRRPLAARFGSRFAVPAASFMVPDARSVLSPNRFTSSAVFRFPRTVSGGTPAKPLVL